MYLDIMCTIKQLDTLNFNASPLNPCTYQGNRIKIIKYIDREDVDEP